MWFLTTVLGVEGAIYDVPRLIVTLAAVFLFAMVVMGIVGVVIDRFAYRPLRSAPRLAPLITAIGVSFLSRTSCSTSGARSSSRHPRSSRGLDVNFFGAQVGYLNVFIVSVAIGLMIALQLFVGRTRLGRAMRSTAPDREAAALMGVDINRTIALTFFIGSALAGAAGVVQGLYFGATNFHDRILGGTQGIHRGSPWRYRQHDRRGDRRLHHRLRGDHRGRSPCFFRCGTGAVLASS